MNTEVPIDIAIIILAALVQAGLQLSVGTLLLLYKSSLGRHLKKQTRRVTRGFILGAALFTLLSIGTVCFVLGNIVTGTLSKRALIVIIIALMALAVAIWCFYYRSGPGTALWVPRKVSRYLNRRARVASSGVEGAALGMVMSLGEIALSVCLLITAGNSILNLPAPWQILGACAYAVISVAPLLILKGAIKTGRSAVEVQKWRVKNKTFLKVITGVGYLVLAVFLAAFKVF